MTKDTENSAASGAGDTVLEETIAMGTLPGGRMLTRGELAAAAGCSETTIRRLEERKVLAPVIGPRGVHLFQESQARDVTLQFARRVQFRPQTPDSYDGTMAAAVFDLLDEGVERVDIVKRLQVDPRALEALFGEWARLKGGFVVDREVAVAIGLLGWIIGTFPIRDGAQLLANLTCSAPTLCGRCRASEATVCVACARMMSAQEAARAAAQHRERVAAQKHEKAMEKLDRELERKRTGR
jgi:hypothetical protein